MAKIDRPVPANWKRKTDAPPREAGVFSLLTYNVKNMFDSVDAAKEKGTAEKPVWEMNASAKVVRLADPDVMTNQEVENIGIYKQWGQNNLEGRFANQALVEGNDRRGIDVAAMSRYPIVQVISHKDEVFPLSDQSGTTKFSRDLLRVDIDVEGEVVSVYTTHSVSRRDGKPEEIFAGDNQRIAESQAIKQIVTREMSEYPQRLYIITGDFNDDTQDPSLQALINGPGDKLVDTLDGLDQKERNTWPSAQPKKPKHPPGQFDHILIPERMKDRLLDSQVLDFGEATANGSDHKPIRARFRVKP
jgi:endonuclease/exonuclease/phosphatase family metal-dependent hydrolase